MSCWAKKGSESAASHIRKMQNKPVAAKPKPTPRPAEGAAVAAPVAAAASSASFKAKAVQDGDVFGLASHVGDKIRFFLKKDGLSDSEDPVAVEGVLFAFYHGLLVVQELDPVCVRVIQQKLLSDKPTVLQENYIQELNALPNINHEANARFYDEQVAKERKRREAIGQNVSAEAQQIYDILRQTFPMRWQEPHMIIMPGDGQTTLSPPYTERQLSGQDSKAVAALARVLNGIRKKHNFDHENPSAYS